MFYYVTLDENNICTGIHKTSMPVAREGFQQIDSYDTSLLGKKYENGEWVTVEYPDPEPEPPTQLDRIEAAVNLSQEEIRQEGALQREAVLKSMGAAMTFALASAAIDVPPEGGAFAQSWPQWTADGETAAAKSLWLYQGTGYQARTDIQKIEDYAPNLAPNNYAVRPIPDGEGIFPAVINMDVSLGMKLRDTQDNQIYECYANPITSLQWQPHELPSSFRLIEGEEG